MSIIDQALDRRISENLAEDNEEKIREHKSTGKLSASMLNQPVQWQVLKHIGFPQKEFDSYTLRKFKRGNDIEEWLVSQMMGVIDTQVFVEYGDAIGYLDALVDSSEYDFKKEKEMPHEVKSVTNAKFKRIQSAGGPDHGHALQGSMYTLGLGKDFVVVDYAAADDLRILSFVVDAREHKDEIDRIIKTYDKAISDWRWKKIIPVFEYREKWQSDLKYCNYPDFMELTSEESLTLVKEKGLYKEEV